MTLEPKSAGHTLPRIVGSQCMLVQCTDLERSVEFYQEFLRFEEINRTEDQKDLPLPQTRWQKRGSWVFGKIGCVELLIGGGFNERKEKIQGAVRTSLILKVDDVTALLATLKSGGVRILSAQRAGWFRDETWVQFWDPDYNLVSVVGKKTSDLDLTKIPKGDSNRWY